MGELSRLISALEARFCIRLEWCSGGNSSNLNWLNGCGNPGRINHLRLGEALLLGREPLTRKAIPGLYTDAITLVAEVIEAKVKPSRPWGSRHHSSFATPPRVVRSDPLRRLAGVSSWLSASRMPIPPVSVPLG
jgi:predicted amino acid racemase